MENNKLKTFIPLNVSSKFAICGLPIRVDTYKNCSFGCTYCFSNNRIICEFDKHLQVGDINFIENKLNKIENGKVNSFLDKLIINGYTWHCGGMSDPFQPAENKYHITKDMIDVCNKHNISILFSTKSDTVYDANINPDLHTFQLSVTNLYNRKDLEPNVPDIEKRYEFYRNLKNDGFKVGIRLQPFIPGITSLDIVKKFSDADMFTLEGIKIVPQNTEHKNKVLELTGLSKDDFIQMGLLNMKPEIRLEAYQEFIKYFEEHNIPYSISDNDLHYLGNNICCCGDRLVKKATEFNNTYLFHTYGTNYTYSDVHQECIKCGIDKCKCNNLFTSNRQEGCKTVDEFFEKRFCRESSVFSPKFAYFEKPKVKDLW